MVGGVEENKPRMRRHRIGYSGHCRLVPPADKAYPFPGSCLRGACAWSAILSPGLEDVRGDSLARDLASLEQYNMHSNIYIMTLYS